MREGGDEERDVYACRMLNAVLISNQFQYHADGPMNSTAVNLWQDQD